MINCAIKVRREIALGPGAAPFQRQRGTAGAARGALRWSLKKISTDFIHWTSRRSDSSRRPRRRPTTLPERCKDPVAQ